MITFKTATKTVAACAVIAGLTASFGLNRDAGMPRPQRCGAGAKNGALLQLPAVLENTMEYAAYLPDSEVFSRSKFKNEPEVRLVYGFGRDGLVREACRMAYSMFSTSRPPVALELAASGFLTRYGAKTMNPANTLPTSTTGEFSLSTTQLANIENALSLALFLVRRSGSQSDIHRATAKAIRAAALLKQVSTSVEGGAA